MSLKWNVFRYDINKDEIVAFNVFDHWRFNEDVQKSLKKFKDKDEFAEQLRRDLQYYFWSKCEYEVIITSFPPHITMDELDRLNHERWSHKDKYGTDYVRMGVNLDAGAKIDIYEQVMNNWSIFLDYVWNSKRHRTDKKAGREYVKATGKCPMCEDCPDNCPMEEEQDVKCIVPNFFEELAELMKRYNIESVSPFCNCEIADNHYIKICDDGMIKAVGMKIE